MVLRSFWLQSSLSYEGMQNLGRLFCLVPLAKWLGLSGQAWRGFVARHLSYFNSNPYISPLGLGALARIEADAASSGGPSDGTIERFSMRLSAPLGAVGDALFWATIRPQVVLTGVLAAFVVGPAGAGVTVLLWLVWVGAYRWLSFGWGWRAGQGVAGTLNSERFRRPGRVAGQVAAFVAGAIAVTLLLGALLGGLDEGTGRAVMHLVAFTGTAGSTAVLMARRQRAVWAVLAAVVWVAATAASAYIFGL